MRAFLLVTGGLAGLVVLLFLLAGGQAPLPPLAPRLAAGESLAAAEAKAAFSAWRAGLPAAPAVPLRLRYSGEVQTEGAGAAQAGFTADFVFADARHGRVVLVVEAPGAAVGRTEIGVLADGKRMAFWTRSSGAEGESQQAFSIEQALAEEIWGRVRESLPALLQLGGVQADISAADLPSQPLLLLHPGAWTEPALRQWNCTGLVLAGERLRARLSMDPEPAAVVKPGLFGSLGGAGDLLPQAMAVARSLGVEAEFDVRTGIWTALRVVDNADAGGTPGAASISLRNLEFTRRSHEELLQLPAGIEPEDVTARARLFVPMMQAAVNAGPREF